MKVVGLITEYNPFHNGHKYHIDEARKITGADYVIAVMSGDFVQRGTPAVIDKYSRTEMALKNGVDLVIELPVCYATGSAEFFTHGAVSILSKLGIVDYLCFGSESGDISLLQEAAKHLSEVPASFDEQLRAYLKEGFTYPAARSKALKESLARNNVPGNQEFAQILTEPNNILGIEYLKAIQSLSSSLQPVTIKRKSAHYHDKALTFAASSADVSTEANPADGPAKEPVIISSATAIRNVIDNHSNQYDILNKISSSVPPVVYHIMKEQYLKTFPVADGDFAGMIKYKLLAEDHRRLSSYMDITEDLADRLKNFPDYNLSYTELLYKTKSKNMTLTRINRAFIHLLLNVHAEDIAEYKANDYSFYARVLGIKKESSHLLRKIEESGQIPVITKVSKASDRLNALGMRMLSGDIFAAHLYNQVVYEKYKTTLPNEYKHGICITD